MAAVRPQAKSRGIFEVGDPVIYTPQSTKTPQPAVVRFVGNLAGKTGLVGLEFYRDGCGGKGDGSLEGARGFRCPLGRGLYVSHRNPRLAHAEAYSSETQRVLREIGMSLEERMETNVLREKAHAEHIGGILQAEKKVRPVWVRRWVPAQGRYLFFDRAWPGAPGRAAPPVGAAVEVEPEGGPEMRQGAAVEARYLGPRLADIRTGMVSESEALAVLEHVAQSPDEPLHADYLLPLVWRAAELFDALPSLVRIPIPRTVGRVIVLGDTHGHLKDVIHVFRTCGTPSPGNVYLFNGDICDRGDTSDRGGQQGVAIWSVVLCFKVLYPDAVFFNRGNHEDWYNNLLEGPYGQDSFHAEIHRKFPVYEDAHALKNAFRALFFAVPIAHVVGDRAVVVHGGLWRAGFESSLLRGKGTTRPVTLCEVERVDRKRDIPIGVNRRGDMILNDTCWNDPHDGFGLLPNPRGGNTLLFGWDVTETLCAQEDLALLVRSHDWPRTNPPHGHEWFQHGHGRHLRRLEGQEDALCISLFTASDYCGGSGNMGAALLFTAGGAKGPGECGCMAVQEWTPEEAMRTWKGSLVEAEMSVQADLRQTATRENFMGQLKALIVASKPHLFAEFSDKDATQDFHVPIDVWAEVCTRVMGAFPWASLLGQNPSFAIAAPAQAPSQGLVCYTEFLARHQIRFSNTMGRHAGLRRIIASRLYEALLVDDQPLRDTLAALNPIGDGSVSVAELQSSLSRVLPCVTHEQAWTMLRTTIATSHHKGTVPLHALLDSLRVRFASTYAKPAPVEAPWVPGALPDIGRDILLLQHSRSGSSNAVILLTDFFAGQDRNHNGYLEFQEFIAGLRLLPSCAGRSEKELLQLADYCDLLGNGRINYLELLHAFNVEAGSDMAEHMHEDLLEGIYRVLYFNFRGVVAQTLEQYLVPGTTRCTPAEFAMVLRTANAAQGGYLTNDQIDMLKDTFSVDEADGRFDFEEYFASFEILDMDTIDSDAEAGEH